jgi:hypothetical protein
MEQLKDSAVVESVVAKSPFYAPGRRTPHTLTRGMIVGALLRRVDPGNRSYGQFVQEDICTVRVFRQKSPHSGMPLSFTPLLRLKPACV